MSSRRLTLSYAASLLAMVCAGSTGMACRHAGAKTLTEVTPLEVPPPPPRVVEVVEAPAQATIPLVEEPQRQPVLPPPRQAPRVEAAKPEVKPEPPPAEAPKVEEAVKPPPVLQTTPATAEGQVERSIRVIMEKASSDLNRVNTKVLNADAMNQFETAKRFIQQADAELRTTRNLVFARNLADKAAALAAQLAGR